MASKTALDRFDYAVSIAESALQANRSSLHTEPSAGGAPEAVAAFFAKGLKSMQALRILAAAGYGEDAFILLRSLTNTAIDWRLSRTATLKNVLVSGSPLLVSRGTNSREP